MNAPLRAKNQQNVWIVGGRSSRLIYSGPPTMGAVQFHGVRKGGMENVEIVCNSANADSGVLITNSDVAGGYISHGLSLNGVHIRHGGYPAAFAKAFSIDSYAGDPLKTKGGGNNDLHRFDNCSSESHSVAGIYINGHQAHDLRFTGMSLGDAVNRRPYGVWSKEGVYFHWQGSMHHNRCDFQLGNYHHRMTSDGHNSEHSWQLVSNIERAEDGTITKAATSAKVPVTFDNFRFDGDPKPNIPVVDLWGSGMLNMRSGMLSGVNGVCPRVEFWNYSKQVNGVWVPMYGTTDLTGLTLRQHLGTIPSTPLIRTPNGWGNRTHALEYEYVDGSGIIDRRRIQINQPLPGGV